MYWFFMMITIYDQDDIADNTKVNNELNSRISSLATNELVLISNLEKHFFVPVSSPQDKQLDVLDFVL